MDLKQTRSESDDRVNETLQRHAVADKAVNHPIAEAVAVPKYLWKVSYTKVGVRGVAQEGASSRRDAVRHAIESLGGALDAAYFAIGEADVYVIGDCRITKALLLYRWPPT